MRRERVTVAVLDEELDTAIAAGAFERAVRRDPAGDHAAPRWPRDVVARWPGELDVVRYLDRHGPPRARGRAVGGELARAYDRRDTGGRSSAAIHSSRFEPHVDDHHLAAWRVWTTLDAASREVLVVMFARLGSTPDGGALQVARDARARLRRGEVSDVASVATLPPESLRPGVVAAITLGRATADASDLEEAAARLEAESRAARRTFRAGLQRVELDIRPPLLVPAPAHVERPGLVVACDGVVAIVAGVRVTCETREVLADTSSCARCGACGFPIVTLRDGRA